MRTKCFLISCLFLLACQSFYALGSKKTTKSSLLKPRIVVLTDISTWETDDSESLVRLLAHADLFEIEGLIYTTGWSLEETREDFFALIHDVIDAYEKDLPNLMKRSNQQEHITNEEQQLVGYWPSPEYLRKRTVFGSKKRGIAHLGKENVSEGSDLIIKLADEADKRPLWILLWGGGNTLAQAIWQVRQERGADELNAFLRKLPTYAITDQDRAYQKGTPYNISSHQWMRHEFGKDLMFLWDESAWMYQNGTGKSRWEEYAKHIQEHGNLGKVYPKYKYGVEGDTPSFLHVIPNGLNDPEKPEQVGWGGYFKWGISPDNETYAYTNHKGEAKEISSKYETRFYQAAFNNFAARMDWAKEGKGNRNPVAIVNGDQSLEILKIKAKQGKKIVLDASKSYDPDGDLLTYKWWILPEAGTYIGDIEILNSTTCSATVIVPSDAVGKEFHVICEITDDGTHSLTGYRRIIIGVVK